jgi:hypothetical protein
MLCLALLLFHFYCNRNFDWFVTNKTILYNIVSCRTLSEYLPSISVVPFIWVPFSNTFAKVTFRYLNPYQLLRIVPLLWEKVRVLIKMNNVSFIVCLILCKVMGFLKFALRRLPLCVLSITKGYQIKLQLILLFIYYYIYQCKRKFAKWKKYTRFC